MNALHSFLTRRTASIEAWTARVPPAGEDRAICITVAENARVYRCLLVTYGVRSFTQTAICLICAKILVPPHASHVYASELGRYHQDVRAMGDQS